MHGELAASANRTSISDRFSTPWVQPYAVTSSGSATIEVRTLLFLRSKECHDEPLGMWVKPKTID
jgi:hypothetical protein